MVPGVRLATTLLLAAAMTAPYQCASKARPELRMEDEPGEALYKLADRFAKAGDAKARAETLRFIVERYPSSRFAEAAKVDLAQMGVPVP